MTRLRDAVTDGPVVSVSFAEERDQP